MPRITMPAGRAIARLLVIAVAAVVPALIPIATVSATADGDTLAKQMYRLRVCESGNRYHINTGNGYYGAYQFDRGTWRGLGYRSRPDRARPKYQDAATVKLHNKRGWRPWPACARKMHLH
jgi:hypothetical protein